MTDEVRPNVTDGALGPALDGLVLAARIKERVWSACREASMRGSPMPREVEDWAEAQLVAARARVLELVQFVEAVQPLPVVRLS